MPEELGDAGMIRVLLEEARLTMALGDHEVSLSGLFGLQVQKETNKTKTSIGQSP